MLVDKGATIDLLAFQDCDLVPVIGPDDEPYQFDNGYLGNGTGVICADADGDGRRGLVGVDLVWQGAATSTTHRLSRTVVEPDGTTASHGHHDVRTVRLEGHEDARYRGIDCGPMSLTAEMLDQ